MCGCCADEKPPEGTAPLDHKTMGVELYGMEEEGKAGRRTNCLMAN